MYRRSGAVRSRGVKIRDWMGAVFVAATILSGAIHAQNWLQMQSRHTSALRAYLASGSHYDQGRATVVECIRASELVLTTELDLAWGDGGRIASIRKHLDRTYGLLDLERKGPRLLCNDPTERLIREGEDMVTEWKGGVHALAGWRLRNGQTRR
jgi:hypothetical protein